MELKEELYDKVENIKKYLVIFIAIFIAGCVVPAIYLIINVVSLLCSVDCKLLQAIFARALTVLLSNLVHPLLCRGRPTIDSGEPHRRNP